ncbi:MAG: M60 family metallopeptidase [Pyrinomonadaceae bacterium]|nr:M60 family metallopeptidase [Pyrinomonadaceae bacterium]
MEVNEKTSCCLRETSQTDSSKMKTITFTSFLIFLFCSVINAQTFDNYKKEYVLKSITDGQVEASRTHRMILCDYQPSGLYVRKGEKITLNVSNLNSAYNLSSMIGFKPMWGDRNKTQENNLRNGANTVTAIQDGILSFIFVKREGYDTNPALVNVNVVGGKAFPLYKLNRSNPANWQNDLKTMTDAPFVQLISDKVLITIPYRDYLKNPIPDIPKSFQTIHQVIDWEDELAGFDNSTPENMRTNNRIHYLIDLYSTPKEAESYYMYASNYMIGMKRDNYTDLTEKLDEEWGIWHETGHTHQQDSWTWGSISEISVNMFSLYVQEKFGQPSRLNTIEGDETETTFNKARKYVANPNKNYLEENEDDYNELFSKLVMFHQLKSVYGWDSIKKLHQYFRKNQYVYNEDETDQDKVNKFVYAMCLITKNNLMPFFKKWGLNVDSATAGKINALRLPLPTTDPAKIFR